MNSACLLSLKMMHVFLHSTNVSFFQMCDHYCSIMDDKSLSSIHIALIVVIFSRFFSIVFKVIKLSDVASLVDHTVTGQFIVSNFSLFFPASRAINRSMHHSTTQQYNTYRVGWAWTDSAASAQIKLQGHHHPYTRLCPEPVARGPPPPPIDIMP